MNSHNTGITGEIAIAVRCDISVKNTDIDGFYKGVMDAGYNPVRIDKVEHINRMGDKMIVQLNTSTLSE